MRNAQVSFEFIVVFAVALLFFVLIVSVVPSWLDKSQSTGVIAENLLKDLKQKVIIASLAETDYRAEVVFPSRINDIPITLDIQEGDDLAIIKQYGDPIAKVFLPQVDHVLNNDPSQYKLIISKTNNELNIERTT